MRARRIAAAIGSALALVAVTATPAAAQGDTTAVAINTKDGFDIFKLAFQVRRATGDVVDTSNGAVAYASCTDCQTVALSIQVLLISGYDSSTVAPENVAIAINDGCSLCETLASAYQFILTAEGNLHFTPQGSQELARIRQALRELGKSDLSVTEIQARLDTLMDDLAGVLANELVPAGTSGTAGASPSTSASPTADATAPPPPSETAEPTSESPTPEETTAEPSATGTP